MSPTKRDLVLGYNHGYSWPKLAPFFNSLRATGFAGDISLFTSGVEPGALMEIRAHGVLTLESPCRDMTSRTKTSPLWKYLRFAPAGLHPWLLRNISEIATLRHFLYEQHLAQNLSRYRQVLLTDVRDVAFQTNPFAAPLEPGVQVFEEDGRHSLATRPINAAWIRESFGLATLQELGHLPILCAGTLLGETAAVSAFLGHLCRTFARARSVRSAGIDQGIFNVAARTWQDPRLHFQKNGAAAVLTMGNMNHADVLVDPSGWVRRANGEVIPVLHQFDRHPGLCQKIKVLQEHDWLCAWGKSPQMVPA